MKKANLIPLIGVVIVSVGVALFAYRLRRGPSSDGNQIINKIFRENEGGPDQELLPLAIAVMREREYPGSEIVIEQELEHGSNYSRYIASYKSEGLKIFGLLTVPDGNPPTGGWSAIIFNHGYIRPDQYVTTQRYVDYVNGFATSGYIVFKPDYRGHGNSEGSATGNYFSPGYAVDILNAVSSIKKFKDVNPEKIGMWGHSMGGNITMRNLVVSDDIKAAVIWAGVIGSYEDILNNWSRASRWRQSAEHRHQGPSRQNFLDEFGTYDENPDFWKSIDPHIYLGDIDTPVQLHHGTGDTHVPLSFSENFKEALDENNKSIELHSYEGADHNLSGSAFGPAMKRSVEFFDKYLK